MAVDVVRNSSEYPSPSEVAGKVVFDDSLNTFVKIKDGATNAATTGGLQAVTTTATIASSSGIVTAGNTTSYALTLPDATLVRGKSLWILKTAGTGTITITPVSAQTINGAANKAITTQWTAVHLVSDGANWNALHNGVVA